jgi:hypothetical protein
MTRTKWLYVFALVILTASGTFSQGQPPAID